MTDQYRGPYWIDPSDHEYSFPDVELALREPDGLLAVGGDLSPGRLLQAYRAGIFPWYSEGQPILWWCPDPRAVLFLGDVKVSRSLAKTVAKTDYEITMDTAFSEVVVRCAGPRKSDQGTWITEEMFAAYQKLHELGMAHSVEYWQDGRLAGGLYGVAIGRVFFGESMFSQTRDASKVAFVYLSTQLLAWEFPFIDCQIYSKHLGSLGATRIPRKEFSDLLNRHCDLPAPGGMPGQNSKWSFDPDLPGRVRANQGI